MVEISENRHCSFLSLEFLTWIAEAHWIVNAHDYQEMLWTGFKRQMNVWVSSHFLPPTLLPPTIIHILNQKSRYCSTPGNFPLLLHIKAFFHFINHFQLNQAIILVAFLSFPARNPPAHNIIANFHIKNHIRSRWRNQLIHKLRVWSNRSKGSWFKPCWVFQIYNIHEKITQFWLAEKGIQFFCNTSANYK